MEPRVVSSELSKKDHSTTADCGNLFRRKGRKKAARMRCLFPLCRKDQLSPKQKRFISNEEKRTEAFSAACSIFFFICFHFFACCFFGCCKTCRQYLLQPVLLDAWIQEWLRREGGRYPEAVGSTPARFWALFLFCFHFFPGWLSSWKVGTA